tara:strand:+ start:550 stop:738 length:189 start_codon:yes stop_codon:yes gene_type:complete
LRNEYIRTFSKEDVLLIEDISQFVAEQYEFVKSKDLDKLLIPEEKPFYFSDEELNRKLKISK